MTDQPGFRVPWQPILRWGGLLGACAIVLLIGYVYHVNQLITETFEGRRWTLPAKVFAQPVELYPGAPVDRADLVAELARLGYQRTAHSGSPGTYREFVQDGSQDMVLHLRAFTFPEGPRPSQQIRLRFEPGGIRAISDASGRPVPLIRLDPLNIGSFFPSHGEDRMVLAPEKVPQLLTAALIAVEDTSFGEHHGFDLRGIARAIWVNVTSGEIRQGGSTLTQQLVKSYYLDNRRTLERKLKEVVMAVVLELKFDKDELLNAYINEIYLGQDGARAVHGFGLGSQFYFNKPLHELETWELATLVAIIRGPSWYNPYRHPQRTHQRRDLVLAKMFEAGLIDSEELERNLAAPFQVARGARGGGAYYPAFLDLVRETLSRHYDEADLTGAGLTVFTTLSPRTQDAVERTLHSSLQQLDQQLAVEPHNPLQGAVVVANSQTGEIEALSGGRAMGVDGFNRAINARRPIGSLVKPVIYLAALERGYSLISPTEDAPITLTLRGSEPWSPQNFDGELHGTVPLIRALGDSLNLATVNLGLGIGLDQIATRLQELTGRAPENPYPSLLLGAEPMSPLEVTSLYATFASGGYHLTPKTVITVLDESGAPLTRHPFELDRRIDPERARAMVRALEVVMEQGTGTTSRFAGQGVAGKTGTSDDYRDSWFAGFDARRVAVVWVGFDDNQPTGMTGAGAALKIWDALFARLGLEPLPGPAPDWRQVEYASGLIASEHCAEVVRLPLPAGADARYKSGCGLDLKQMADRIGRKFKEWFE